MRPWGAAASAGPTIFSMDSDEALSSDLRRVDAFTAPCALLVLCAVVGNPRLMVVPLVTLVATMGAAFSLLYAVAGCIATPHFCPSLIASCMVAASVDYALFMLTARPPYPPPPSARPEPFLSDELGGFCDKLPQTGHLWLS